MMLRLQAKRQEKKSEIVIANSHSNIEVVEDFVNLGSAINQKNRSTDAILGLLNNLTTEPSLERQKLLFIAHLYYPCFYVYGAEARVLSKEDDETLLGAFERKILRKIYGPICVDREHRSQMNYEQ